MPTHAAGPARAAGHHPRFERARAHLTLRTAGCLLFELLRHMLLTRVGELLPPLRMGDEVRASGLRWDELRRRPRDGGDVALASVAATGPKPGASRSST